jgi:glutathione S-transferase
VRLHVDARYASPFAMSAFVALREKGVSFEIATVDLAAGAQHAPAYAAASDYARRQWERPSVREWVDRVRPLLQAR